MKQETTLSNTKPIKLFGYLSCKHRNIKYCKVTDSWYCEECEKIFNENQIEEILETRNAI